MPTSTKYLQKLREHIRWAHKTAHLFHQREAWHHRVMTSIASQWPWGQGTTVLVHVTAFKGWHKVQNRWENREYVVEEQPYPNLPMYVVCPMDGEGHGQTLHSNYLLPINNNEHYVQGVEPIDEPTPVPQAHNESLADGLTKGWPVNDRSQAGQDQPAPLRQSACITRNQPSQCLQYVGWPAHLSAPHGWPVQCFWDEYSVKTLYLNHHRSVRHKTTSGMDGDSINVVSMAYNWMGEWIKGYFIQVQLPHWGKPKGQPP